MFSKNGKRGEETYRIVTVCFDDKGSYVDWFCYREQFKRSDMDSWELLYRQETEVRYLYTRRLIHLEGHPEYWWWTRKINGGFT